MDPNPTPETPIRRPNNTNPELKREYLKMIPTFSGEPLLLTRFLEVADRLYENFFDQENLQNFQNHFLYDSILSKITGKAVDVVFSNNVQNYEELREVLISNFSDKRDFLTLTSELTRKNQKGNETCFEFHGRIMTHLNSMIAYLQVHKEEPAKSVLVDFSRDYALRVFVNGLPEATAALLRARSCKSLDEVLIILRNEFNLSNQRNQNQFQLSKPQASNPPFKQTTPSRFHPQSQRPQFSTPNSSGTPPNNSSTFSPWKPRFNSPSFSRTPFQKPNFSGIQRQNSTSTNQSKQPTTSTPRNFHLIESSPESGNPGQNFNDESPQHDFTPGFSDGSNFYPCQLDFNHDFQNMTIAEEQEQDENAAFLEEQHLAQEM